MNENKVVLITGASSGIGKECAGYLAGKNYKVYGTSRNPDKNKTSAFDKNFFIVKMDVTNDSSVKECIEYIIQKESKIDILINNAGIGIAASVEKTLIDEYKNIFETNFYGCIRTIQNILPYMREKKYGLIINMSSMLGVFTIPFQGGYCASKFALEGLSECLSMELNPFGIKVVLIEPGDIKSDFNINRIKPEINQLETCYKDNYERALKVFIEEEEKGLCSGEVAKLVHKIIMNPNPKLRYSVGHFMQKMGLTLKQILPNRRFEKMFLGFYNQK